MNARAALLGRGALEPVEASRRAATGEVRRTPALLAAVALAAVLAACGDAGAPEPAPRITPPPDEPSDIANPPPAEPEPPFDPANPPAEEPPTENPPPASPAGRVRLLYVAASDESEAEIVLNVERLERATEGIRGFYSDALGEAYGFATFRFEPAVVLRTGTSKADWATCARDGIACPHDATDPTATCNLWYATSATLREDGLLAAAGLPPLGGAGTHYHAAVGGAEIGSCGAASWLSVFEAKLLEDADRDCPSGRWDAAAIDCRSVGAMAHELGHGFGLPHCRDGCDGWGSIMWNWPEYDRGATLDPAERATLAGSPFFRPP